MPSDTLFLGTGSHVVALDRTTGAELWRTKLKSGFASDGFVSLLVQADRLYAHTAGELFCLDRRTGAIQWENGLAGLGYGIASLAVEGAASVPAAAVAAQRAAATAATSGTTT